jgi:hypothetical protein
VRARADYPAARDFNASETLAESIRIVIRQHSSGDRNSTWGAYPVGLTNWRRERIIHRTLRSLARQQVAKILQPGDVWVVERPVSEENPDVAAALRTCHMRGWVEVVDEAVPRASLTMEGALPQGLSRTAPVYRLTEGGWNVINRIYTWVIAAVVLSFASFVASIVGIVLTAS